MDLLAERWRELAPASPVRVVFPEFEDIKVLEAAVEVAGAGPVAPVLPAEPEMVEAVAAGRSLDVSGLQMEPEYAEADPVVAAGSLLQEGRAEACVLGFRNPWTRVNADLLPLVPGKHGHPPLSGGFLVQVPGSDLGVDGALVLADGLVHPRPEPEELAQIAVETGRSAAALLGPPARVAMLSFSTLGSGKHPLVDRVTQAVERAQTLDPELALEGELQADAALVEAVGEKKAPGAKVAGSANALVFPDLQAADTSLRLLTALAGAAAVGPFLQGLALPVVLVPVGATRGELVRSALAAAVLARA